MAQALFIFVVAFCAELCAAGYTLALARGRVKWAVLCSGLIALLNAGIFIGIVDQHALLIPSVLGEVCGTAAMMRLTIKR